MNSASNVKLIILLYKLSALRQVSSWDNPEPRRPKSRSNDCDTIEDEFWSSEVSNSDEDDDLCALPQPPSRPLSIVGDPATSTTTSCGIYGVGENIENGEKYVALADYTASGPAEVTLKEGDVVILVKIGCGGWWFVKMVQAMSGKKETIKLILYTYSSLQRSDYDIFNQQLKVGHHPLIWKGLQPPNHL